MLGGLLPEIYSQLLREGLARGFVKQVVAGGKSLPVVVLYLYMELCVAAQSLMTLQAEAKDLGSRRGSNEQTDDQTESSSECLVAADVATSLVEGLDVDGDDRSVSALVLAMAHFASLETVVMAATANRAAHDLPNQISLTNILQARSRAGFVGETALQLLNRSQDEGHFERLVQLITLLLNMDRQGAIYQTDANILVEICLREIGEGHSPKVVSILRPVPCANLLAPSRLLAELSLTELSLARDLHRFKLARHDKTRLEAAFIG